MNDRIPAVEIETRRAADVIRAVVRPEIRALAAYQVAKPAGLIKLDANENPFPLPPAVREKIAAAIAAVEIHRYPDAGADAVIAALRASQAIPPEAGVLLGNGSDELLAIITTALAQPGAVMLVPEPTFVMYRMNATYAGMRFVGVPLTADLTLDIDAMLAAIARERPALIFLATPNNPTGVQYASADIERILRAAPGLVVVDEAYLPFTEGSFVPRVREFPNLVVVRTLSKVGMAALRLGYAIGAPEWIDELNKVRQPYNLNSLTQAAALALLANDGFVAEQVAIIRAERARLAAALAAMPGVAVFPTQANFVLARVPDAKAWHAHLVARGILVKSMHGAHPLLAQCLRVTVGTPAENDALLAALRSFA
jgi:histidinol-phosphate aminotransferase